MRKKRILFAAVDIGYRIEHYTKFINTYLSDRLIAESFSKYILPETHYKTKYTYSCPIDKTHPVILYLYSFSFFIFSLFRYDIFHFISGETILTRKLRRFEFWVYKFFGKKIIMHFVGGDIRSALYLEWKRENLEQYLKGVKKPKLTEDYQDKLIKDTRKYADNILVSTPDLLDIIPEAEYFPVVLDIDKLDKDSRKNSFTNINVIKVLHSPSGFELKGSEYINKVLDELKEIYQDKIELILPGRDEKNRKIYSMTRYDLLETFKETDIVIDQMLIGWYGLKSIEALASGCEAVCYIEKDFERYFEKDNPIINANILNLKDILVNLINKLIVSNNRLQRLDKNRSFVFRYHHIDMHKDFLKKIWLD
jgi:hypothetical protein